MIQLGAAVLLGVVSLASDAGTQAPDAARPRVIPEGYDYAPAMRRVAARFRGAPGVYLNLGDSLTYARQNTSWARAGRDHTPEEQAFLAWSHCGQRDARDGWHLASVDVPTGRSHTAASGVRADEFLQGGKGGLPPLSEIIRNYNPQLALYLIGSNDIAAGRPVDRYIQDVEEAVDLLLDNGTVAILSTLPPFRGKAREVRACNAALRGLALEKHIPLIDLHAEMRLRAGAEMDLRYLADDGVHLSAQPAEGEDPDPPGPVDTMNLAQYGYLLRCYLSVHKGMEVKSRVFDRDPPAAP